MKVRHIITVLLLSVLGAGSVSAQHYIGVHGGYGGGSCRFLPKRESGMIWGMAMAGVSYKYYSRQLYVGGVGAEINYLQKGYKYDKVKDSDTSFQHRLSSIELPIIWQPYIYLFNRNARFFINLGLTFSYNFAASTQIVSKKNGVLSDNKYDFELVRDNRWGYGLVGGAGLSVLIGRAEIVVEARYFYGFSDLFKNKTKYDSNPLRSPLDNIYGMAGIYWRLGKGGILAPPGKRLEARLAEAEVRRKEKEQARSLHKEEKEVDAIMKKILDQDPLNPARD